MPRGSATARRFEIVGRHPLFMRQRRRVRTVLPRCRAEIRPQGLKPRSARCYRGAEAPLFHDCAGVRGNAGGLCWRPGQRWRIVLVSGAALADCARVRGSVGGLCWRPRQRWRVVLVSEAALADSAGVRGSGSRACSVRGIAGWVCAGVLGRADRLCWGLTAGLQAGLTGVLASEAVLTGCADV